MQKADRADVGKQGGKVKFKRHETRGAASARRPLQKKQCNGDLRSYTGSENRSADIDAEMVTEPPLRKS